MEGSNEGTSVVEGFSLGYSDGTEDIDGCSDGCAEILGEEETVGTEDIDGCSDGTEDIDGCSDGCAEDLLDFPDVVDGAFVDFAAVLPIMAAEYCS